MIELCKGELWFRFPEVYETATMIIGFVRTLRIPDDGKVYPLPPGFGLFPLHHVDDHAKRVPKRWLEHGGVMLPMYQSEAMWLSFSGNWPCAVKIATGKVNVVSGEPWKDKLNCNPQDYVVAPRKQPWLDGYCVEKGIIRQFVATPLGAGVTTEEQVTGKAEHGGLQITAYPMKRESHKRLFPEAYQPSEVRCSIAHIEEEELGLAPGGRMKQEIYKDPFKLSDWDLKHGSRCFVHICNSIAWHEFAGKWPPIVRRKYRPYRSDWAMFDAIFGEQSPTYMPSPASPPTAKEYTEAGLPWFDYYDDNLKALKGSRKLKKLKSVAQFRKEKSLLPENESTQPRKVIHLSPAMRFGRQVREWAGQMN